MMRKQYFATLFLVISLLIFHCEASEVDLEDFDSSEDEFEVRRLQAIYGIPLWWKRIKASFRGGTRLKRCIKRRTPPPNGSRCSRRPKTCYFDSIDCDGFGAHPKTECVCSGRQWQCTETTCPARTTNCPFQHNNDPKCPPPDTPLTSLNQQACTRAQETISCSFGEERCCGVCHSAYQCFCQGGQWQCLFTDACLLPSCSNTVFAGFGYRQSTCTEMRTQLFEEYPSMDVVCVEADEAPPADFNADRYAVQLDSGGTVTNVHFNTFLPPTAVCPTLESYLADRVSCPVLGGDGLKCVYEYSGPNSETANCKTKDDCTCFNGSFTCEPSVACVSANPPVFTAAP